MRIRNSRRIQNFIQRPGEAKSKAEARGRRNPLSVQGLEDESGWRVCGESQAPTRLSSKSLPFGCDPHPPGSLPLPSSSSIPHLLDPSISRSLNSSIAAPILSLAAMAMAMGVASMAVTVPRNASLVCHASATNTGEKETFLNWFRNALNKDSLSKTDDVLAKVDGKSNVKSTPPGKKAALPLPPLKKAGFIFFGKK